MIRYRAVLFTSKTMERSVQNFGNDYQRVIKWARDVVEKYPDARIEVYQSREDLIEIIYPSAPEASAP